MGIELIQYRVFKCVMMRGLWRLELRILGNLLTKFKFPRKYILHTLSRVLLCAATFIRFFEPRARARAHGAPCLQFAKAKSTAARRAPLAETVRVTSP